MLISTSNQHLTLHPDIATITPNWGATELQLLGVGYSFALLLTSRLKNIFAFLVNFLNRPFRLSRPVELIVVRDGMCVIEPWLLYSLPDSAEAAWAEGSCLLANFPRRLFSEESRLVDVFWRILRRVAGAFSSAVLITASACASPTSDMLARRFALCSLNENCAVDLGECSRPRGRSSLVGAEDVRSRLARDSDISAPAAVRNPAFLASTEVWGWLMRELGRFRVESSGPVPIWESF